MMRLLGMASLVVVFCGLSDTVAAQEEAPISKAITTELDVSDLKQWYCSTQSFIEKTDTLRGLFDRVAANSVVFVNAQGEKISAPLPQAWKKSPKCTINERTNEKIEKSEKSG